MCQKPNKYKFGGERRGDVFQFGGEWGFKGILIWFVNVSIAFPVSSG